MPSPVAVIGNSGLNIGFAVAADLSLAGHEVRLAHWPDCAGALHPVRARDGFAVQGDPAELVSGRLGHARPAMITTDVGAALRGAEVVFLDVEPAELEARFATLLPDLADSQIVHVNMHGGWPALRLAPLLREAGKDGVTITEGAAPTMAAGHADGIVVPHALRRRRGIAAFPAVRIEHSLARLRAFYPALEASRNVLQTGFETMNLLVHPGITLFSISEYDRAEARGEPVRFYAAGNSPHTGRFAEAQDAERQPVCAAYEVPFRSLREHIGRYYGAEAPSVHDAILGAGFYQKLPPLPAATWRKWLATDMPLSHVPFVAFAELAGIAAPLHRAMIAVAEALLGQDFWAGGLTLDRLGLAGFGLADMQAYVNEGVRP